MSTRPYLVIYDPRTGWPIEKIELPSQKEIAMGHPTKVQMIQKFNSIGYCTKDQLLSAMKAISMREQQELFKHSKICIAVSSAFNPPKGQLYGA